MATHRFWKTLTPEGSSSRHYEILQEIASGGMATVYLGSRRGPGGFERIVALKRALPPRDGIDPSALLAREAQLASRVHHANVVSVIDAEVVDGALLLIMEYVEGASLGQLLAAGPIAPRLLARILLDATAGLEAIHATTAEDGTPWNLVHRDISPQNLLVGVDGVTRVADFGIATTQCSTRSTGMGARRGKPGYMAPEYVVDGIATASCDIFALSVVAWEALTGRRLFGGATTLEQIHEMHQAGVPRPSDLLPEIGVAWDNFVMRALGRTAVSRYDTAHEFERGLLHACGSDIASRREVASFVEHLASEPIWLRRAIVRERLRESDPAIEAQPASRGRTVQTRPEVPLAKRAHSSSSDHPTVRIDDLGKLVEGWCNPGRVARTSGDA